MSPKKFVTQWLLLFYLIALISCHKNDNQPSIIGKWNGDKAEFNIVTLGITTPFGYTDDNFDTVIEFKNDGTVVLTQKSVQTSGTFTKNGDQINTSVTFNTGVIDLSGTYTIKELTSTKLTLYIEKNGSVKDPNSGVNLTGTVKTTLYFNKV
jgi:hypothetical protein